MVGLGFFIAGLVCLVAATMCVVLEIVIRHKNIPIICYIVTVTGFVFVIIGLTMGL